MLRVEYTEEVKEAMRTLYGQLSEKDKRRYAAAEVMKLGHGGQKYICEILGCSPATERVGRKELASGETMPQGRIRKPGGGKKKIMVKITDIDTVFLAILEDHTAGSPMNEDMKWTDMTQKEIVAAFVSRGYTTVTRHVVRQLLKKHK